MFTLLATNTRHHPTVWPTPLTSGLRPTLSSTQHLLPPVPKSSTILLHLWELSTVSNTYNISVHAQGIYLTKLIPKTPYTKHEPDRSTYLPSLIPTLL